jgi:hypothetical protein
VAEENSLNDFHRIVCVTLGVLMVAGCASGQAKTESSRASAISYLKLTTPQQIMSEAQSWEGDQFPHTLSVLELKRGGFRYWGWYGLNEGRGIGLARSNDLVHWTKYEKNPLWTNARWPSVLAKADPAHKHLLYFAITRDYDTPSSYIALAHSKDGIHLIEDRVLVAKVANQRNQNPNLFHDPRSGRFYLTFYRGNDHDHFEIVSKNGTSIHKLYAAPEKVLLSTTDTVAAPTLLWVRDGRDIAGGQGLYYLATEIYPHRYTDDPEGEWQVKAFVADSPDGNFEPIDSNPVMRGQRACLFQHIFHGRFYGYDCHLDTASNRWMLEEVEAPLP